MSPGILYIIEVIANGLMTGVMYSLVALGFVLIFKASGIFNYACLLYTSPSPRDATLSRMPSSA